MNGVGTSGLAPTTFVRMRRPSWEMSTTVLFGETWPTVCSRPSGLTSTSSVGRFAAPRVAAAHPIAQLPSAGRSNGEVGASGPPSYVSARVTTTVAATTSTE